MLYFSKNDQWDVYSDKSDNDPHEFLSWVYEKLRVNGTYPDHTPVDGIKYYRFLLRHKGRFETIKNYHLEFLDASGEVFRWATRWSSEHSSSARPIDVLKGCRNIICLLNVQPLLRDVQGQLSNSESRVDRKYTLGWQAYFEDFHYLLDELRRNEIILGSGERKLQNYKIAFCITKADIPTIWQNKDNLLEFVSKYFDRNILHEIYRYVPVTHMKWFAVSAIGPRIVDGRVESATTTDGRLHPDHELKPYGLFEPIEWLLGINEEGKTA